MIQVYVYLIKNGLRTIDEVPTVIREKVRKALEEDE